MKEPSIEDADRCFKLRCQTKQGIRLHPDDSKFIQKMYNDYPEWYSSISREVFNATLPYGA